MIKEPKATTKKIFNYLEMVDYINEKFNVNIDDFAGLYNLPDNKKAPDWFLEWTKKNHGVKDMDELCIMQKNDNQRYVKLHTEYNKNHEQNEPPYQNFWHFVLDNVFGGEIPNGSIEDVNFDDFKVHATEDWQRKILDMFIQEFGQDTITVEFSW